MDQTVGGETGAIISDILNFSKVCITKESSFLLGFKYL